MVIKKTHIGSYAIIVKNEKIALVRKSKGGYKGKLDLPGGGIEFKEDPITTLKREVKEEIDNDISSYSLFSVASNNIKWKMSKDLFEDLHHIGILYLVNLENDYLKSDSDERDSLGGSWYLISDLKKEDLTPFARYSLEKLGYKL